MYKTRDYATVNIVMVADDRRYQKLLSFPAALSQISHHANIAPFPPLFGSFNMALSRAKPFALPMKTPALQAISELTFSQERRCSYLFFF